MDFGDDKSFEQPCNGDTYLQETIRILIELHQCRSIVETGTCLGTTAFWFASLAPTVTIESNQDLFRSLRVPQGVKYPLATLYGRSESLLRNVAAPSPLVYLDAHWGGSWPVLDEIKACARLKPKVIVVHDCQVPGREDLGYDSHEGKPLSMAYLRPTLTAYFPFGYSYSYNSQATGAKRGVVFIQPRYG